MMAIGSNLGAMCVFVQYKVSERSMAGMVDEQILRMGRGVFGLPFAE